MDDKHIKLMKILESYGNYEFGTLIIDDICRLFNYPITESEE